MAEIRITSRCAGCPGNITWLLSDGAKRTGAPQLQPEGDCLTRDEGSEVFCPSCTEAALACLEQRRAVRAPAKKNGAAAPAKEASTKA